MDRGGNSGCLCKLKHDMDPRPGAVSQEKFKLPQELIRVSLARLEFSLPGKGQKLRGQFQPAVNSVMHACNEDACLLRLF